MNVMDCLRLWDASLTVSLVLLILTSYFIWHLRSATKPGAIPGPWYCKWSNLPIFYHELRGSRTRWIHELHIKYGPVIRIAYNEVHFNSLAAVKVIYGVNRMIRKDDFYMAFRHHGVDHVFSTLENAQNVKSRRHLTDHFSVSTMKATTREHRSNVCHLDQALDIMLVLVEESVRLSKVINFQELFTMFSSNVILSMVYGHGALATNQDVLHNVESSCSSATMAKYAPRTNLKRSLQKAGYSRLAKLAKLCMVLSQSTRSYLEAEILEECSRNDLGNRMSELEAINTADVEPREPCIWDSLSASNQDLSTIIAEARALSIAGTVTTPSVLTYLLAHLASDAKLMIELRKELESGGFDVEEPLLTAVCYEGSRLCPPIPMSLPRYTLTDIDIAGHRIPANTKVCCQAYSINRLSDSFARPDEFDHTRWLRKVPLTSQEAGQLQFRQLSGFWAFSSGARVCLGRHLALQEVKMALKALLRHYDFEIVSQTSATSMEAWREDVTSFTTAPKLPVFARFRALSTIEVD